MLKFAFAYLKDNLSKILQHFISSFYPLQKGVPDNLPFIAVGMAKGKKARLKKQSGAGACISYLGFCNAHCKMIKGDMSMSMRNTEKRYDFKGFGQVIKVAQKTKDGHERY